MDAEPDWCGVCGLPVPAGEKFCRWPAGARVEGEAALWASHSLAFMTELVELQHWRCPWCGDYLPDSPPGTAIDHIIPRAYGVTISMDIGQFRAGVRRRAAKYAVRATRQLDSAARDRALTAARNLTVFYPEARVNAAVRAAAQRTRPAGSPD